MDDARVRDITRALPPAFAGQLFTAREQGANEQQLQQIAADGLAQMYFRATTAANIRGDPLVVDQVEGGMPIGGRIRRYPGGCRQDAVAGLVGITRRPGPLIRSAWRET
ncbi:hypothetical protein [Streptomyces sp. NPDC017988]|uniref:hypothetical protein n=1 Tax=Streptomyces sp. NPDC017988 TaxID=3365025 RepID=UPI003790EC3C